MIPHQSTLRWDRTLPPRCEYVTFEQWQHACRSVTRARFDRRQRNRKLVGIALSLALWAVVAACAVVFWRMNAP